MKNPALSVGHEEDRGCLVVRFLEEAVTSLRDLCVLDMGCGQGDISVALGASLARLVATDLSVSNLKRVQQRLRSLSPHPSSLSPQSFLCASSALELPFRTSSFDLVILNGVLEWVGKARPNKDPEACQFQALQELFRTLKKGGSLYLAIENRYYPLWAFGDPHVRTPLVAVLPRRVANLIQYCLKGQPYLTYIHSYRKLRSMVEKAGFEDVELYIPLLHYRWPFRVVPAADGRRIAREIASLRPELRKGNGRFSALDRFKLVLYRSTAWMGLSRFLFPSFVILARKQD